MTHNIFAAIAAAALVTFIIRVFPILVLAHRPFPIIIRNWLSFVPTAILTAIIAVEVMGKDEVTSFGVSVALLATLASVVAGFVTRSLFVAIIASILGYLLFQNI
ncbi:AzlD domain-containing protein [Bartonella sp. HY329]|uniref:AzlD domain-containing protein n=1 Tax=unclassified Bartonella TaxID=2645622 RepID=UPI0021C833A4|nr:MULTISPECIES: AzlD domain-containing protein [unclassified Bartonella]UXM94362.1 AzlD domain-containing protein [Bartonella sp. HY329]UXN08685.1 AzlD domain-containing protein [Bartonella sp. HY328]